MKIKGVGFVAIPGEMTAARERYSLLLTALAPVVPQIIGSAFNIWYNKHHGYSAVTRFSLLEVTFFRHGRGL